MNGCSYFLLARILREHRLEDVSHVVLREVEAAKNTYRVFPCQDFFTVPPALTRLREELHVAVSQMRSMVSIEHE